MVTIAAMPTIIRLIELHARVHIQTCQFYKRNSFDLTENQTRQDRRKSEGEGKQTAFFFFAMLLTSCTDCHRRRPGNETCRAELEFV